MKSDFAPEASSSFPSPSVAVEHVSVQPEAQPEVSRELNLLHEPLPLLLRKTSIPAITGMFFGTLYNIVDTIYAGLISPQALAAMTLSFPVFFLTVLSFSVGFSSGLKSVFAYAIGQGDRLRAGALVMQGIPLAITIALVVNLLTYLLLDQVLSFGNADAVSKALSKQYLQVITLGGVSMAVFYAFIAPLGGIGDTRTMRNIEIAAACANVILNPIFMYGWFGLPALGLQGLALATVITWCGASVYAFWRLAHSEVRPLLHWKCCRPQIRLWIEVLKQAVPSILNMIRVGIIFSIFAVVMGKFGTFVLAGYGVGFRIEGLIILPVIGLNMASIAIFAQNYGANRYQRVRDLYHLVLKIGVGFMIIGAGLMYVLAPWLVVPFSDDPATRQYATEYLRIDSFGLPAIAIINLSVALLQGMQRTGLSLLILVFTQALLPALVLPYIASIAGYAEVWWSMVVILWLSALSMLGLIIFMMQQWKKQLDHASTPLV